MARGRRWLLPAGLSALLAAAYGPDIARSDLLQGDAPGHLEMIRWSAAHLWPLPWGWDPRYLGGAPIGILYPPLLTWIGGALAKFVGVAAALKLLAIVSVAALPPAMYAAARGSGLGAAPAAWAAAAGTVVLWLPGIELAGVRLGWRGLGGSLHQSLVTGNLANALALPLLLLFIGRLRLALSRSRAVALPSALLALLLAGHFLVGAAAGALLVATAIWRSWRLRSAAVLARAARLAAFGVGGAAFFLIPFAFHLPEASPDAIGFSPLPGAVEWLALVALAAVVLAHPRRGAHPAVPWLALLVVLYLLRGAVFPSIGTPPVRMEYHRFRVFLYLATVPATLLLLQARRGLRPLLRPIGVTLVVTVVALAVFARHDARGPRPVPRPGWRPDGHRVLVLASPGVQRGSSHGLQLRLPAELGFPAAKGQFVESSRLSRRVFELERLAAGPGTRPRWWAIRADAAEELRRLGPAEVAGRFSQLAVDRVLAREPVSPAVVALASAVERLADGYTVYRLAAAPWARPRDGAQAVPATFADHGRRLDLDLGAGGVATVSLNAFSDWRVEEGQAELTPVPPGVWRVEGRGRVTLAFAPRVEEWLGLGISGICWTLWLAGVVRSRRRRSMAPAGEAG